MFLCCHTYYSLRYGVLSPQQLVEQAQQWGIKELALTDINNCSCAIEFIHLCRKANIKPILGIDFRDENQQLLYIGLARNAEGLRELNALLTHYSRTQQPLPYAAPPMQHAWIIYPRRFKPIHTFRDNELLGIRPEHVAHLFQHELLNFQHKIVILKPVVFVKEEEYQLHTLLRAIDKNTVLSKLSSIDLAKKTERLVPPEDVYKPFDQYPDIIRNTRRILDSCTAELPTGLQNNRQTFTGDRQGDFVLLEKLAMNGLKQRYPTTHQQALPRLHSELQAIKNQRFCAYFLITWDIVRYAEASGYRHVGRGSGANSLVAYCLRLTDVDPLELNLYFERFINPYRPSPPDFDIDFSWDERDDVLDYIFKRYGQEYVALMATYSTFQRRALIRELGKVYGLPKSEIDLLVQQPGHPDTRHEIAARILHFAARLEGFPNHLSIHAGGVLISERPLNYHCNLQLMPKGFPVTTFDMHHAEDIGFHKYDILSQRGIGHIKEAVALVKRNQGHALDINDFPTIKNDPKVKAQLKSGHCIGCFYIESPAMRMLLHKLECDTYQQLVAASSIIRPGVAKSGMMRAYIQRSHQPQNVSYLHPVFEEQLGETYGIMVYQEDVMKILHHFAGLDLTESDLLRRIMSGKKAPPGTVRQLQQKFRDNCTQRAYSDELITEVWRQIESFSGYSFCKAHSASFAVESFQSLYLKTYYPLEFMVAVINNFGGFYQTEYYVHEARMQGATIHPPSVNHSLYLTHIEGTDIYIGFVHVQKLELQLAHRIVRQRAEGGTFRSLADFIQRVKISDEQLDILIRIGAFQFTGQSKQELFWEKSAIFSTHTSGSSQGQLFGITEQGVDFELPSLQTDPYEQAFDELDLLGFTLCSPFELLKTANDYDCILASDLHLYTGRRVCILGYYVCQKSVRTSRGQHMAFGTWLDRQGHFWDTVHFPNFLKDYPFRGKGIYKVDGKVVEEFGVHSIEVIKMHRLPMRTDERFL